jgi:hypothetical protein
MLCEICEKRDAKIDDSGACAECKAENARMAQIHYRFVQVTDRAGRIGFNVETRSGHRDWQYNQSVGNDTARLMFVAWADTENWILHA